MVNVVVYVVFEEVIPALFALTVNVAVTGVQVESVIPNAHCEIVVSVTELFSASMAELPLDDVAHAQSVESAWKIVSTITARVSVAVL